MRVFNKLKKVFFIIIYNRLLKENYKTTKKVRTTVKKINFLGLTMAARPKTYFT